VACSYSGETEETLSVWEQARERGMPAAAITTGGTLGSLADSAGAPRLPLPEGHPPRAALPASLATLLSLLDGVGPEQAQPREALEGVGEVFDRVAAGCGPQMPAATNPAKDLALWFGLGLPVLYAPDWPLGPVAVRWRGQIAENGKRLSAGGVLPEADHNEIVGWHAQSDLYSRARVLFLEDEEAGERLRLRSRLTSEAVARSGADVRHLQGEGPGMLARMMHLVALGDLTSVYLALGWGIDPSPVESIDRLKAGMAEGTGD
jgi:glucose/mannose-6-phosphate isomerase